MKRGKKMKKLSKTLLAVAAVSVVSAAMAASAMAADTITAEYTDGVLSLSGVAASGKSQTLLIFKGEATDSVTNENANEIVVAINQEDGDTTDQVLLETDVPVRALEEGATYQIRVGGENGNVQTGQFTYTSGGVDPGPGETIEIVIGDANLDGASRMNDATYVATKSLYQDTEDNANVGVGYEYVSGLDEAPEDGTVIIGDANLDGASRMNDATYIATKSVYQDTEDNANVGKRITVKATE